jgi:micrococcal nuclease
VILGGQQLAHDSRNLHHSRPKTPVSVWSREPLPLSVVMRLPARALLLTILMVAALARPATASAQTSDCSGFDSQIWAQSVVTTDPTRYDVLDPDGNGLACDDLPPGAAPALWTNTLPTGTEPATFLSVTDGNTLRVRVRGIEETVRLLSIDSPNAGNGDELPECYGQEAKDFLTWLLALQETLYLEPDVNDRDQEGRLLRYVWLDFGQGEVYLVNEAMVRSGHATTDAAEVSGGYGRQIRAAQEFAHGQGYGLWGACGAPPGSDADSGEPGDSAGTSGVSGCGPDRRMPDTICPFPSNVAAPYVEYLRAAPEGVQIRLTKAGIALGQTCAGAARLASMASDLYQQLPSSERVAEDLAWAESYLTSEIRAHSWAAVSGIPTWEAHGNPIDIVFADYTSPGHAGEEWEDIVAQSLMDCGDAS